MSEDLATLGLWLQADWHAWLRELVESTTVEVPTAAPLESLYPAIAPLVVLEEEMAELMRSLTTNFLPPSDSAEPPPIQETIFNTASPKSTGSGYPRQPDFPGSIPDRAPLVPDSPLAKTYGVESVEPNEFADGAEAPSRLEKTSEPSKAVLGEFDAETYNPQNLIRKGISESPLTTTAKGAESSRPLPEEPSRLAWSTASAGQLTNRDEGTASSPSLTGQPSAPALSDDSPAALNAVGVNTSSFLSSANVPQPPHPLRPADALTDSTHISAFSSSSQEPPLVTGSFSGIRPATNQLNPASTPSIGTLQDFASALRTTSWAAADIEESDETLPETSAESSKQGWQETGEAIALPTPTQPAETPSPAISPIPLPGEAFQRPDPTMPFLWENSAGAETAQRSGLDPPPEAFTLDPDQILDVIQDAINRDYRRFYGA